MEDFYANRENWPQSADAFTYVAARKRHVIDIDGFLQKVSNLGLISDHGNFFS